MMIDVITGQSESVSRVSKNEAVLKKAFGHFTPAFYQWPYGMIVCCGSKAYVIQLIKTSFTSTITIAHDRSKEFHWKFNRPVAAK